MTLDPGVYLVSIDARGRLQLAHRLEIAELRAFKAAAQALVDRAGAPIAPRPSPDGGPTFPPRCHPLSRAPRTRRRRNKETA